MQEALEEAIRSCLSEDALDQNPSDSEILRFSDQFDPTMMYNLVLHLGITDKEWKDMEYNHPGNIAVVRFLIMTKWREAKSGKFRDVFAALGKMKIDKHKLCQVRRVKKVGNSVFLAPHVDYVPTDEILDALAPQIGIEHFFNLGIELGLGAVYLKNVQHQYQRDPVKPLIQVLYDWRNDTAVKATLGVLEQALVNVGRGVGCLETVVKEKGVEKRHISRKHDAEGALSKTQDHDLQAKDSKSNVKTEEKTVTDSSQQPSQQKGWRTVSDLIKEFESPKN